MNVVLNKLIGFIFRYLVRRTCLWILMYRNGNDMLMMDTFV